MAPKSVANSKYYNTLQNIHWLLIEVFKQTVFLDNISEFVYIYNTSHNHNL